MGIGVPGTGLERQSKDFQDLVSRMDVVISKGQGNYEALSDTSGIFFLLMAKCPVVAAHLGVEEGSFILKGHERDDPDTIDEWRGDTNNDWREDTNNDRREDTNNEGGEKP